MALAVHSTWCQIRSNPMDKSRQVPEYFSLKNSTVDFIPFSFTGSITTGTASQNGQIAVLRFFSWLDNELITAFW